MKINEVYLATVQFVDQPKTKQRPVLVIQIDPTTFTCFPITSKGGHSLIQQATRYPIRDYEMAGLDHQSFIRVDRRVQFLRLATEVIRLGKLSVYDRKALNEFIRNYQANY